MSGINIPATVSNALTALLDAEEEILAQAHPSLRTARTAADQHHGYLRVAQVLEVEALGAARRFEQCASSQEHDDSLRSYAHSRSREFSVMAARCGEAWVLYESLMSRPTEEIVLEMCEAGFCDHARFIVTGAWDS
ncbi:MAG: hypothetical protein KC442_10840 [Thermomicrobiales bacterium]|nr:hypothetical protein [Thermomicrobiales bacterium]